MLGDKQSKERNQVIDVIDRLTNALQTACDLVSSQLGKAIIDYNKLFKSKAKKHYEDYLTSVSIRCDEAALGKLLREGEVCGELHKLGDAFKVSTSRQAMAGLSLFDLVKTFFCRTNKMHYQLVCLEGGEQVYLQRISGSLLSIRQKADDQTGSLADLRARAAEVRKMMDDKRSELRREMGPLLAAADKCRKALA